MPTIREDVLGLRQQPSFSPAQVEMLAKTIGCSASVDVAHLSERLNRVAGALWAAVVASRFNRYRPEVRVELNDLLVALDAVRRALLVGSTHRDRKIVRAYRALEAPCSGDITNALIAYYRSAMPPAPAIDGAKQFALDLEAIDRLRDATELAVSHLPTGAGRPSLKILKLAAQDLVEAYLTFCGGEFELSRKGERSQGAGQRFVTAAMKMLLPEATNENVMTALGAAVKAVKRSSE